jgi:hypothetical protein
MRRHAQQGYTEDRCEECFHEMAPEILSTASRLPFHDAATSERRRVWAALRQGNLLAHINIGRFRLIQKKKERKLRLRALQE